MGDPKKPPEARARELTPEQDEHMRKFIASSLALGDKLYGGFPPKPKPPK